MSQGYRTSLFRRHWSSFWCVIRLFGEPCATLPGQARRWLCWGIIARRAHAQESSALGVEVEVSRSRWRGGLAVCTERRLFSKSGLGRERVERNQVRRNALSCCKHSALHSPRLLAALSRRVRPAHISQAARDPLKTLAWAVARVLNLIADDTKNLPWRRL